MSRTLDQLLSEPDDEDIAPEDSNRLQQLLSDSEDEDGADVGNLIKDLETSDASRLKQLESKTPDIDILLDEKPERSENFYVAETRSRGNSVDIAEYFENELRSANKDIHYTKTPDPSAEYGDLEWAGEESAEGGESSLSNSGVSQLAGLLMYLILDSC